MIRFACSCGQQLQADEQQAGGTAACPVCARNVDIPAADVAFVPTDPWYAPGDAAANAKPAAEKRERPAEPTRKPSRAIGRLGTGLFLFVFLILGLVGALPFIAEPPQYGEEMSEVVHSPFANLTELSLAFRKFNERNGRLPAPALRSKDGKALLSWRVAILPYLASNEELSKQIHPDEAWDSAHNLPLLSRMPLQYADQELPRSEGRTRMQVYVGPGAAFEDSGGLALSEFTSASGKAVLVVEGEEAVPWTKPSELEFGPRVVLRRPFKRGMDRPHYLVLASDLIVHSIPATTSADTLYALILRNNTEPVPWP